MGAYPTPLCTGHCSQHLDGGEGVICLTRSQVSLGRRERVAQGGCGRSPGSFCFKPAVFSRPVDGGGHLLLGSWHGSTCSRRQESCQEPCLSFFEPGPEFIPQQEGSEQNQLPATPPPPRLARGGRCSDVKLSLRAWSQEPACRGLVLTPPLPSWASPCTSSGFARLIWEQRWLRHLSCAGYVS